MDDESDQRDEEEAQGLGGDVLLAPDLFEIPAQHRVGERLIARLSGGFP